MFQKMLLMVVGCIVSLSVQASDLVFDGEVPLIWQRIIVVSGGVSWSSPGQNQYIYPYNQPPTITQYLANKVQSTLATGEVLFALQRLIQPGLTGQLGLGLAGATDSKLEGVATVDGIPDVYAYNYLVNHGRLEIKGKLIASAYSIQPYVSGSFGVAFNGSHGYFPVSAYPITYPAPYFVTSTAVAFPYTLGVGLQTMVSPNWQVGIGYEFADLGKSYLAGDGATVWQGISLTHLYTNSALFSVGYVF